MNRIEILIGSDWIMNSARSRLPRDVLLAALILGSLALFAFPIYPFPPGYDSTTDPRVAGFPFTYYCLCSVQTSPDSWTSTYQLYWIALIEDFLFWISIVFLFDIMLPKGRSRGTFQPLRMLAHMSVRESQPRTTRRVTGTAVGSRTVPHRATVAYWTSAYGGSTTAVVDTLEMVPLEYFTDTTTLRSCPVAKGPVPRVVCGSSVQEAP